VNDTPAARWITRADELADACARWSRAGELALDTEFVFERTYFPRLGLIQVAAAGEVALVDPVAVRDLAPLGTLLADPAIEKVLHAAGQDGPVLARATGGALRPLFDTQCAAALCGLGSSLAYGALVENLLGVALGKHETRTDWLRRPLTPEQLRYAAEDVAYLPAIAGELRRRLLELGRLDWALEDSAAVVANGEPADPAEAWRRLRGIERLPAPARRVARALAAWREREALARDLARPFLLRDETLLALARRTELAPEETPKLPGYDARRHAHLAGGWAAALAAALADADGSAEVPVAPPPSRARRATERAVAAAVARRATELGLPAELLLPRRARERVLDAWEEGAPLVSALGGWRREALGPALVTAAAEP